MFNACNVQVLDIAEFFKLMFQRNHALNGNNKRGKVQLIAPYAQNHAAIRFLVLKTRLLVRRRFRCEPRVLFPAMGATSSRAFVSNDGSRGVREILNPIMPMHHTVIELSYRNTARNRPEHLILG